MIEPATAAPSSLTFSREFSHATIDPDLPVVVTRSTAWLRVLKRRANRTELFNSAASV